MIPNFETNTTTNTFGFHSHEDCNTNNNNMLYGTIEQQPEKHDHHNSNGSEDVLTKYSNSTNFTNITTTKDPLQQQYQTMKDSYANFFSGFQPNFQRFAHFGNTGGFYQSPYAFYDRVHELEAKIPLDFARVWLDHQTLWRRFSVAGNEMIITKMGRRMFPVLSFGVHSLNFADLYTMEVEVVPSDNNRYKYVSVTGWRVNGVASQHEGNKCMFHPEGVQTGEYWQKNGVAFKRIKLTNKKTAKEGSNNIVLNSMHKYHIQLVIKHIGLDDQVIDTKKFEFKETEFIAVTAYQNDDVTQLKIDHNPFAKAFRDNSGDHSERTQFANMFVSQSKRRKFDEYDGLPQQQSHVTGATIFTSTNTTEPSYKTDTTFSSLSLPNNIHQPMNNEEKSKSLYNFSNNFNASFSSNNKTSYDNNVAASFGGYTYNNQYNNGWFPTITFDGTDIGVPNLQNIQEENINNNVDTTHTDGIDPLTKDHLDVESKTLPTTTENSRATDKSGQPEFLGSQNRKDHEVSSTESELSCRI